MGTIVRLKEKVRQAFGSLGISTDSDWQPTSNARNDLMLQEAKQFAKHLKMMHADLSKWTRNIDAGLISMRTVLQTPLPKAYHQTLDQPHPVDAQEQLVGGSNVALYGSTKISSSELQGRMQVVLQPIEQWLTAYKAVKDRNKRCQELRLDVDAQRRHVLHLQARHHRLESKRASQGCKPGSRRAASVDESLYKMANEMDKERRMLERYSASEAKVYDTLLILIHDVTSLRSHVAAALMIVQGAITDSYVAFSLDTPLSAATGTCSTLEDQAAVPQGPISSQAAPVLTQAAIKLRQATAGNNTMGQVQIQGMTSSADTVASDPVFVPSGKAYEFQRDDGGSVDESIKAFSSTDRTSAGTRMSPVGSRARPTHQSSRSANLFSSCSAQPQLEKGGSFSMRPAVRQPATSLSVC